MNKKRLKKPKTESREKQAEQLSLDLADKLERNEISLKEMAGLIDWFLTKNKNAGNI